MVIIEREVQDEGTNTQNNHIDTDEHYISRLMNITERLIKDQMFKAYDTDYYY